MRYDRLCLASSKQQEEQCGCGVALDARLLGLGARLYIGRRKPYCPAAQYGKCAQYVCVSTLGTLTN